MNGDTYIQKIFLTEQRFLIFYFLSNKRFPNLPVSFSPTFPTQQNFLLFTIHSQNLASLISDYDDELNP